MVVRAGVELEQPPTSRKDSLVVSRGCSGGRPAVEGQKKPLTTHDGSLVGVEVGVSSGRQKKATNNSSWVVGGALGWNSHQQILVARCQWWWVVDIEVGSCHWKPKNSHQKAI